MVEMLKCKQCGNPSRLVIQDDDICVKCIAKVTDSENSSIEATQRLSAMVDCGDEKAPCGKCLVCTRDRAAKVRETLVFYSNRRSYERSNGPGYSGHAPVLSDKGNRARQALGR